MARFGLRWLALASVLSLSAASLSQDVDSQSPAEHGTDRPWHHVEPDHAMALLELLPESRGRRELNGPMATSYPKIVPQYLSTDTDCRTLVDGIKIARKIARHAPLTSKISEEFRPSSSIDMEDYEGTLNWARDNSSSIYHPTGTCKMGQGPEAVVDAQLKVHGIGGLRVADCSIMPEIVSGNTNAPAIMIGEKASDLILASA